MNFLARLLENLDRRKRLSNIVILCSSILLIVLIELTLQLLDIPDRRLKYDISLPFIIENDHRGLDWRGYHTFNDKLFEIDDVIYRDENDSVFWVPKPDTHPFNSEGTIGDRTSDSCNSQRCIKILSIGDSNTLWDGETSYPFVTREIISGKGDLNCEARLMNAGVHGYSSYQGLKYLKRFIRYKPDIITISFGWNDTLSVRAPEDKSYGKALKRFLAQRESVLFRTVRKSRIFQLLEQGTLFIITRFLEPRTRYRVTPADFEKNLREMISIARLNGAVPVIITRPHYFRKEKILNFEYDVDRYNEIAKRVAISENIPLFDMHSFTRQFNPEKIFSDYSHLNTEGHRLAAEELFKTIGPEVERICNRKNGDSK